MVKKKKKRDIYFELTVSCAWRRFDYYRKFWTLKFPQKLVVKPNIVDPSSTGLYCKIKGKP